MIYKFLNDEAVSTLSNIDKFPVCYQCKHWQLRLNNTGECRKSAPTHRTDQHTPKWPLTHFLDWCGEGWPHTGEITQILTHNNALSEDDVQDDF
jgi:hypothetical protein